MHATHFSQIYGGGGVERTLDHDHDENAFRLTDPLCRVPPAIDEMPTQRAGNAEIWIYFAVGLNELLSILSI